MTMEKQKPIQKYELHLIPYHISSF